MQIKGREWALGHRLVELNDHQAGGDELRCFRRVGGEGIAAAVDPTLVANLRAVYYLEPHYRPVILQKALAAVDSYASQSFLCADQPLVRR